ncbi:MAG: PilZ domain-containing protein [Planctomycetes bacterium]|nr:PilZ domain-containing protein [Planctomycetota bacterium]
MAHDRRAAERTPLAGDIVVRLHELELVGGAANISESGVYFVADAAPTVEIVLPDGAGRRVGELMRIEAMGAGRVGVAVRFRAPAAPPTLGA